MPLSSDEAGRFAGLLKEHAEPLAVRWTELVVRSLRGRLSSSELQRQTTDLQRGFQHALAAGAVDLSDDASAELRAQLGELSNSRARQGFSATETAVSVYALKDALLEVLGDAADIGTLRDYVAFSSFVDRAALFTFDNYVRVR